MCLNLDLYDRTTSTSHCRTRKLTDEQQDEIATRLLTELQDEKTKTSRFQNKTFAIHQADEIHTRLIETYEEFFDSVLN